MPEQRRIIRKLKITEISGVDNPCQEGARMTIMKRAEAPLTAMTAFDQRVTEIQQSDGCSRVQAMSKARQEFPTDFDIYQSGGSVITRPIQKNGTYDRRRENIRGHRAYDPTRQPKNDAYRSYDAGSSSKSRP